MEAERAREKIQERIKLMIFFFRRRERGEIENLKFD
jgi:hypothetical protein